MDEKQIADLAKNIAEKLSEAENSSIRKIKRLIRIMGDNFVNSVLEESLKLETQGGLMTLDGSRRRTLGGVFFYLAKGKLDKETRQKIFPYNKKKGQKADAAITPVKNKTKASPK
jgi:phosphorylated adapter RNA export protein